MLFYATLLLTSFLLTLVILGLKNLIVFVFRRVFREKREDVRMRATAHLANNARGTNLNRASSAWGIQGHAAPATLAKTHPAMPNSSTPWGWPGSHGDNDDHSPRPAITNRGTLNAYLARKYEKGQPAADWKRNIGRPLRDDRSALSGQAYKPSEDAISRYRIDKE